jgi:hypothetical protein
MTVRYRAGKRLWEPEDDAILRARYPHEQTALVAAALCRSVRALYVRARQLELTKTDIYLASPAACRLRREASAASIATRFKPGQVPINKGVRRPGWAPGRMKSTQFKSGERRGAASRNWMPVGSIRVDYEGYQRIKVREWEPGEATGFGNTRIWPLLQRHTWEQVHGPIPPGHAVVFKDGNRQHCAIENLELISRADLMKRNTIHNLPQPLVQTIQLLGALNRQIRKRRRDGEDDRRPADAPVRDAAGAERQGPPDGD